MIREFYILVSMVLFLVGFVAVHYLTHNNISSNEILCSVSKITNISSPSLSVTFYEPRILFFDEAVNPAYPQMDAIDKMDFIYDK